MKRFFTLLIACLFFACTDESGADLGDSDTFVKMYGGPNDDIAYLAKETPDGGFILLGTTEFEDATTSQIYFKIKLIKTDQFGNPEWENIYPPEFGIGSDLTYSLKGRSLAIMSDGYLVVGDRINFINEDVSSLYLLKVDLQGTIDANTSQEFSHLDGSINGYDVIQDVDGNLVVLSAMQDNRSPNNDMVLNKFTPNLSGNVLCSDSISGGWILADGLPAIAKSLYQKPTTGEIMVSGTTGVNGASDFRVLILNDCGSSPISGGNLNNTGNSYTVSQAVPYNNGYALVGTMNSTSKTDNDMFIALTNSFGEPTLIKRIEGANFEVLNDPSQDSDEEGLTIAATSDGGFIVAGSSLTNSRGEIDIMVIKTDAFSDVQWTIRLGDVSEEYPTHIEETSDGGFIIFGNTEYGGVDTMVLTKISINGELN